MMSFASSAIGNPPATAPTNSVTARNLLALAIFVLTFHLPGPGSKPAPAARAITVNAADLPRFHQVHSYFWRGAAPSYAGLDTLKQLGVKTIIDLRRSRDHIAAEAAYASKLGMSYVSLPMGNFIPSVQKQKRFLDIVSRAATDPAAGPVFVHCSHGSDRTGYLTALWRVQHDHWSIAEAAIEMFQYGFLVHKLAPNERVDQ
jgi:protein tyrosine phosphatase (PTP) superfamily phosphohydrolase (DUF442 family)